MTIEKALQHRIKVCLFDFVWFCFAFQLIIFRWRQDFFEGVHTCLETDTLQSILDTIRMLTLHRLIIVDKEGRLKGILSLSDILGFLIRWFNHICCFYFTFGSCLLLCHVSLLHRQRRLQFAISFIWSCNNFFFFLINSLIHISFTKKEERRMNRWVNEALKLGEGAGGRWLFVPKNPHRKISQWPMWWPGSSSNYLVMTPLDDPCDDPGSFGVQWPPPPV